MSGTSTVTKDWINARREKLTKRLTEFEKAILLHQEERGGPDYDYENEAKKDLERLRTLILKEFT